jgi:hypothetical protein
MNLVDVADHPPGPHTGRANCAVPSRPRKWAPVGVVHVTLPIGCLLPEHDHGPFHVVLFPLQGQVGCITTATTTTWGAVPQPTSGSASVSGSPTGAQNRRAGAPPDFAATVSVWPTA